MKALLPLLLTLSLIGGCASDPPCTDCISRSAAASRDAAYERRGENAKRAEAIRQTQIQMQRSAQGTSSSSSSNAASDQIIDCTNRLSRTKYGSWGPASTAEMAWCDPANNPAMRTNNTSGGPSGKSCTPGYCGTTK